MKILEGANLALRFFLELAAVAAVGYWGWQAADGWLRPVQAIAAMAVVVAVWALFVSPRATIEVARPARLAIEFAVWAAAGAALYAAGHTLLGVAFVVVAVVSGSLNYVWD